VLFAHQVLLLEAAGIAALLAFAAVVLVVAAVACPIKAARLTLPDDLSSHFSV